MTQQEELALYKAALIDWEKPYDPITKSKTAAGICHYLYHVHNVDIYRDLREVIPTLYKYRQKHRRDLREAYLWDYTGRIEKGRQLRVEALKKAIEELENLLKIQP